jgi:hypothetical protein
VEPEVISWRKGVPHRMSVTQGSRGIPASCSAMESRRPVKPP